MSLIAEFRTRARHVIGPVLGICAAGYFAYHAVQGDRGLIAWWQLSQRVEAAGALLAETAARRGALENRVRRMAPGSMDSDLLDERARLMLNFGRPDEVVIFTGGGKR